MPELPEVITVTADLKKELLNEVLINFKITTSYRKIFLTEQINNKKVKSAFNIGKQIIIEFENQIYLSIHLGMTGQLLLNKTDKYEKAVLCFSNDKTIYFSDIRKFGHLKELTREQLEKQKSNIGINILEQFDKQKLIQRLQKRKTPIKNLLLDQKLISGAGNIYATDALFLSNIHPAKPSNTLTKQEHETLITNLKKLLEEGITHRGSSMNRYLDLYGNKGSHQNHFRVYKKRNQKCPICQTSLQFEKLADRGSYFCPRCQA